MDSLKSDVGAAAIDAAKRSHESELAAPSSIRWHWLPLVLIVLAALSIRLYRFVPTAIGLQYAQDADEGVYATTAQLALQGYLPYRDFFTPMPPVAIYLSMVILRLVYHPWGQPAGLMALRLVSVSCGVITVILTYYAAKWIGGRPAGLLAAGLLAVDGIVVAQDRRAMLEAPSNLFSILAILCYQRVLRSSDATHHEASDDRSDGAVPVLATGFFSALALLTKGTALVVVIVVLLDLVVRRRWQLALRFGLALAVSYVLLASPFLLACPVEYVKQNYLFHLLRPYGGTAHPVARLEEMWRYAWSWSTVRFALASLVLMFLAGRKVRRRRQWLVVLVWAGLVLVLLLGSRTYWATYFSQLAVPLSVMGGLLLCGQLDTAKPNVLGHLAPLEPVSWRLAQIIAFAGLLLLGYPNLRRQYAATRAALEQTKPTYVEMAGHINDHLPPDVPVVVFETNYTFLSSHPPAGVDASGFFVDSYGEMLYRNLGIPDAPVGDLVATWLEQERAGSRTVFHRAPAQIAVQQMFDRSEYVVLDGRAMNQLTAETSAYILDHSDLLGSTCAAELRVRSPEH